MLHGTKKKKKKNDIEDKQENIFKFLPCADIRPRINIFSFVSG